MLKMEFIGGREVVQKIQSIEPKIYNSLLKTITMLSIKLQAKIKSEKLSGQVLKTRTGTLRRSINGKVVQNTQSITGIIGIGKDAEKYGAMHEFGLNKTERIRSHLRTIKKVFGKPIAPKAIMVQGHSRVVNYPERSFMRTALAGMRAEIQEEFNKAMKI